MENGISKNPKGLERSAGDDLIAAPEDQLAASGLVAARRRAYRIYLFLPLIFLTAALFGGLRFSSADGSFIFLKPPLAGLIFATMLMVLFVRARLVQVSRWFSEETTFPTNLANGTVLLTLFVAS